MVRVLGIAVTLAALGYVGVRIASSASVIRTEFANPNLLVAIAVGGCLYALLCTIIAAGWIILVNTRQSHLGFREGLIIFAQTQILKYLPTNVLHLIGRYGVALKGGASHASLIFATLAETGLLIVAASTVAIVFALPLFLQHVLPAMESYSPPVAIMIALGFLGAVFFYWLARAGLFRPKFALVLLAALSLYLFFFLCNGALIWALVAISSDSLISKHLVIFGVAAAAWLGGFVVPGAPAGLGVREAILTAGLDLAGYGSTALTVAIGYRLITLAGDVIFALVGFALPKR